MDSRASKNTSSQDEKLKALNQKIQKNVDSLKQAKSAGGSRTGLLIDLHDWTDNYSNEMYDSEVMKPYRDLVSELTTEKLDTIKKDIQKIKVSHNPQNCYEEFASRVSLLNVLIRRNREHINYLEDAGAASGDVLYPSRVFDSFFQQLLELTNNYYLQLVYTATEAFADWVQRLKFFAKQGNFSALDSCYNNTFLYLDQQVKLLSMTGNRYFSDFKRNHWRRLLAEVNIEDIKSEYLRPPFSDYEPDLSGRTAEKQKETEVVRENNSEVMDVISSKENLPNSGNDVYESSILMDITCSSGFHSSKEMSALDSCNSVNSKMSIGSKVGA